MSHLTEDFGVTALLAAMVVIGCFALLWKGVDESTERSLLTMIDSIVIGFIVYKATKVKK